MRKSIFAVLCMALVLAMTACSPKAGMDLPTPPGGVEDLGVRNITNLTDLAAFVANGGGRAHLDFNADPSSPVFPLILTGDTELSGNLGLSASSAASSRAAGDAKTLFIVENGAEVTINSLSVDIDPSVSSQVKSVINVNNGSVNVSELTVPEGVTAVELGAAATAESVQGNLSGLTVSVNSSNPNAYEIAVEIAQNTGTKPVVDGEEFSVIDSVSCKGYKTLDEAIEKAVNGSVIKLLDDVDASTTYRINGKTLTLDLNGKTISNSTPIWNTNVDNWSIFSVGEGGNATITGNGKIDALEDDCYAFDVVDGGKLIIENGEISGNVSAVYVLKGSAEIKGGEFSIKQLDPYGKGTAFTLNCEDDAYKDKSASIAVTGGSFVNFDPAANAAESKDNSTNFVAAGFKSISESSGTDKIYTVVAETN